MLKKILFNQLGLSTLLMVMFASSAVLVSVVYTMSRNDKNLVLIKTEQRRVELIGVLENMRKVFRNRELCDLNLRELAPGARSPSNLINLNQVAMFLDSELASIDLSEKFPGTGVSLNSLELDNNIIFDNTTGIGTGIIRVKFNKKDLNEEKDKKILGGEVTAKNIEYQALFCDSYPFSLTIANQTRDQVREIFVAQCPTIDPSLKFEEDSLVESPVGFWTGYCRGACGADKPIMKCL